MMLPEKNTTEAHLTSVQEIRVQLLNAVLLFGSLFGITSLLITLLPSYDLTWQNQYSGYILIYIAFVVVALLRNRIPYQIKTTTVIACIYGIALLQLLGWGLIGSSGIWFMLMVLFAMIFHGTRTGIISLAFVVLSIAILTIMLQANWWQFSVDFDAYGVSNTAWLSRMIVIVLVCGMLVTGLGQVINVMERQLATFQQRSIELAERSQDLIEEMDKRKDAESALADLIDHLTDLDQLKDQFIDAVSHELRTPIANIQLYHQLLGMKPEKASDYLKTLTLETERLAYIVEQMLYASNDNDDMTLSTLVEIDIQQMTKRLFENVQDSIQKAKVNLELSVDDDNFVVLAAPEHIERALSNIIDNAIKYTPTGGTIRVQFLRDRDDDTRMIGVSIENTGDCPPNDEKSRIFERFVRGESSLKMGVAGAGLGLSIARQIIQKYGGRIDFDCNESLGTLEFTLWLPTFLQIMSPDDDTKVPVAPT